MLMTSFATLAAPTPASAIEHPYKPMERSYTCLGVGLSRVAVTAPCCEQMRCSQFLSTDVLIRGSRTKRI